LIPKARLKLAVDEALMKLQYGTFEEKRREEKRREEKKLTLDLFMNKIVVFPE
jgi:hypothetical protein